MNLKFKYGLDFELRRAMDTLAELDWFNSEGYEPKLPKGINKKSTKKEIQKQIMKEFDKKKYEESIKNINSYFQIIKEELSANLKKFIKKNTPMTFLIYLTNYGVGGAYNLPNIVIFNINCADDFNIIIHEIIHLLVEGLVKKYNIQHWEKERIVDLILNLKEFSFLKYNYWQEDYNNTEKYIDDLFNKYFLKNPEDFFSKIEKARLSINI